MKVAGALLRTSDNLDAFAGDTVPLVFSLDGGGSALTAGIQIEIPDLPFAGTLQRWTIIGDVSGSVVVDILRATYANFPTLTSIAGTAKPTLTAAQKAQNTSLTGWGNTGLAVGDILRANVDSATTITRATVCLWVNRT